MRGQHAEVSNLNEQEVSIIVQYRTFKQDSLENSSNTNLITLSFVISRFCFHPTINGSLIVDIRSILAALKV